MFEIYKLTQGKIAFSYTTKNLNIGALCLNPHQELPKHNRPVTEELLQVAGTSLMKLFNGDTLIREITLHENDTLTIPANQFHIHTNPTNEISVTMWRFEGDITQVLEGIRKNHQKLL